MLFMTDSADDGHGCEAVVVRGAKVLLGFALRW